MSRPVRFMVALTLGTVVGLAGGWEMNHEPAYPGCQPVHPDVVGADYQNGVWIREGAIIGFSLEEDSTIYNDADCV